jgi:hypothetical protein
VTRMTWPSKGPPTSSAGRRHALFDGPLFPIKISTVRILSPKVPYSAKGVPEMSSPCGPLDHHGRKCESVVDGHRVHPPGWEEGLVDLPETMRDTHGRNHDLRLVDARHRLRCVRRRGRLAGRPQGGIVVLLLRPLLREQPSLSKRKASLDSPMACEPSATLWRPPTRVAQVPGAASSGRSSQPDISRG